MRTLLAKRELVVPDGVKVTVNSREVTVEGPRGKMHRAFKHINIDLRVLANGKRVRAEMWHGNRKELATVRSLTTHIKNMIVGVTKGYRYKMRLVYAHFPINVSIEDNGKMVSIRNFLGNKIAHEIKMIDDTVCKRSAVKDELIFEGNSVEAVGQTCATIHGVCKVRNKDIRKFLDGIYVSHTGLADEEE